MKFAHEFRETLQKDGGFPPGWIEAAIPYSLLKKCLKKVESELHSFGLDVDTLRSLTSSTSNIEQLHLRRGSGDGPVAFQYKFSDGSVHKVFQPKLTLYLQFDNDVALDASLSTETRHYLEALVSRQNDQSGLPTTQSEVTNLQLQGLGDPARQDTLLKSNIRSIEVPLKFDAEFFGLLQGDVTNLEKLHASELRAMTDTISILSREISQVTIPGKSNKNDMETWRQLLDIYLHARIFFSTNELDAGSRSSALAARQLNWFQSEVTKLNLLRSFRQRKSGDAFVRFIDLNVTLLRNLKFQEINHRAISKILKKFDKRTSLGAKNTFPRLIQFEYFNSETMAKAVCAGVANEIIRIVPQLDDYLCPVCFSISYKPVRLSCRHVFCIRCMVQMQKAGAKYCPLCRDNVIMNADSANLDIPLMTFLQTYFPKETKAKQRENEIAAGVDRYGESFTNPKCLVM